jgi:hypothetical protein
MKQRVATVLIAVGAWFAAWGMRILARAVVEPVPENPESTWAKQFHAWLETHDVEEEPDWPRQEAITSMSAPLPNVFKYDPKDFAAMQRAMTMQQAASRAPCSCQRCTVRRAQQMRVMN